MVELGCGVSGLLALTIAPKIQKFVLTDQKYVLKLLEKNLESNRGMTGVNASNPREKNIKKKKKRSNLGIDSLNIEFVDLDWEGSLVTSLPDLLGLNSSTDLSPFDAVFACDCIYNEALVDPFVKTCVDLCRPATETSDRMPTFCVIAQQVRSPIVFKTWISSFMRHFRVWRLRDEMLIEKLRRKPEFVVYIGLLKRQLA